jgi:hypothetical protein
MKLIRCFGFLLFATLALHLCACSSASGHLRSQPASYFTVEDFSPEGPLKDLVTLRCARVAAVKYKISTSTFAPKTECHYISADVTKLVNKLPENGADSQLREAVLDLLLGLSDYNCSNFLSRAYAFRSTFDLTSKFIGDLATAASAGTVVAAPGVSVGLDGVNLLIGKANSNFDSQFYADKTFQALESAIAAERTKRKTEILARRSTHKYSLMSALADARFYDDACSIKAGIQNLGDIANKAEKKEEDKNLAVQKEEPTNRAETYRKLQKENQQNNN